MQEQGLRAPRPDGGQAPDQMGACEDGAGHQSQGRAEAQALGKRNNPYVVLGEIAVDTRKHRYGTTSFVPFDWQSVDNKRYPAIPGSLPSMRVLQGYVV